VSAPRIAVIDYGASNLRSVVKALEHVGHSPIVVDTPDLVKSAAALLLPGQGASDPAMRALKRRGLVGPILEAIGRGVPYLGVCLGLQLLVESSEEGVEPCLGVLKGRVVRFSRSLPQHLKVPHMGWNQVRLRSTHPVLEGIPQDANFYFVHSYFAVPSDDTVVAGTTEHGVEFCSVVARENLIATQFHPEKSGALGLRLYDNFVRFALGREASVPWR
jgi:glutamine amidotransferase